MSRRGERKQRPAAVAEFPGVPHRYCQNHCLRDVAPPVLAADSHAKVRMRGKVRGLRAIEREILQTQPVTAPPVAGDGLPNAAPAEVAAPAPALRRYYE